MQEDQRQALLELQWLAQFFKKHGREDKVEEIVKSLRACSAKQPQVQTFNRPKNSDSQNKAA